jgi:hypothetical protein
MADGGDGEEMKRGEADVLITRCLAFALLGNFLGNRA